MVDFDMLTPVQADQILYQHNRVKEQHYQFISHENRLNNWFTVITQQGNKNYKQPSDLYKIGEEPTKQPTKLEIDEYDRALIKRLTGLN